MAQSDTVEKILHAATVLFAERGFAETSLRTITGMADVNLAAVNYHFGSKKELIQAVFARFLKPYCEEIDCCIEDLLSRKEEGYQPNINDLLDCMFRTLLKATSKINEDPQRFMRLLSLAYTQSQEHLRHYLVNNFGTTYHRFHGLFKQAMPELNPVEAFWKMYFMLGSAVFTLSSHDSIRSILNSDYDLDSSIEETIELLIPAMANMLKSSNEK